MTKQAERDELIRTKQAAQAARERLLRTEQTEHNRQTDQWFFDTIKAFTAQSINDDRQSKSGIPKRHGPRKHRRSQRQPTTPSANPNAMNTEENHSSSNDNQILSMETDGTDKTTSNDERQHSETTSAKSEPQPASQSDDSDSVWDTQGQRRHPDETAIRRAGQIFPGQIHAIPKLVTNDADTSELMKKIHASYCRGTRTHTEDTIENDVTEHEEQEHRLTRTHQQNVNTKVENAEENHDWNRQPAADIENHQTDDRNENSVATIMADDGESVASFEYDSDPLTRSASPDQRHNVAGNETTPTNGRKIASPPRLDHQVTTTPQDKTPQRRIGTVATQETTSPLPTLGSAMAVMNSTTTAQDQEIGSDNSRKSESHQDPAPTTPSTRNPQRQTCLTRSDWISVSSTKRKVKDYPVTIGQTICKSPVSRDTKKLITQLFQARDSQPTQEPPAKSN
jgi:hypothetical protein